MITIDKISTPSGNLTIDGNGGEEFLTLVSGVRIAMIITASAGAIGPVILYRGPNDFTRSKLETIIRKWSTGGIKPTAIERKTLEQRVQAVLRRAKSIGII